MTDNEHQEPEPTDDDYVQGLARFTSVAEWAATGRRLAWRDGGGS